jgi:hypothetical protein
MTFGRTGSEQAADSVPPDLIRVASRQDLPARVRELLEGVLGLFRRNLERSLVAVLDEFELNLVRQAGRSRAGEPGERCMESVDKIKGARSDLLARFALALENAVARLDQLAAGSAKDPAPSAPVLELSLVGSTDLDESLTVQEIVTKAEVRNSLPLYELERRFAVLVARPAFSVETLPLGPAAICAALRHALACVAIPVEHRVAFFQTFDRLVMSGIGARYSAANTYFVEQRILRHLQVHTNLGKARAAPARASSDSSSLAAHEQRPAARSPYGHSEDVASFGLAAFEPAATSTRSAAPPRSPAELRDDEQFKPLRLWLAARRRALGIQTPVRTADAFEPSAFELQSALAVLQTRSPATTMLGGKVVQRTLTQLRQDLLNQLRPIVPAAHTLRLGEEDADTIELLGLLFDDLVQAIRPSRRTPFLLTLLQVPMLRVALRDKGFFLRADHPARQALNTIAEIGQHWIDGPGGESDAALLERIQHAIERVNREFDSDLNLLEQVNDELLTHMQSLAHKADLTERRLVDAARGREKLALAREAASRAIALRLAAATPSRLLRTLLEQAWIDVLTLTILRQGERSETYKKQLEVADQLVAAGEATAGAGSRPLAAVWRNEIETGLSQVGYHDDEVRAVVDRLFAPARADRDDNALSQTDLAMRLKSKMRFGDSVAGEAPLQSAQLRQARLQLNSEEAQMLERLKTMSTGAWFELSGEAPGQRMRLKLCWFSALTGRCLLVDQRGACTDERGLEQLARDIVAGDARLSPAERESLLERSWNSVVASLQQLAGATRQ